jgi:DtxR family Mn-dependent transcriptional regulator
VFLVDKLGFGWDEVHDIAEQLEHIEHPELMNRLAHFLGNPAYDPHGDPIPGASGEIHDRRQVVRLSECKAGASCEVKGVVDSSDGFLQHLNQFDIALGLQFVVGKTFDYDGSVEIERGEHTVIWTRSVVENLYVEPLMLNRHA